ncbi:hypothetical protein E2C01_027080 [Portunus trituberculatus]|uniref:Uncharacterized protein n=1 Tax=Portunus trituberculatus TaxID=210409 RepID=A0A5B7EH81_PORTR|nr:hypothetical protein [Portunus trituberculatus]
MGTMGILKYYCATPPLHSESNTVVHCVVWKSNIVVHCVVWKSNIVVHCVAGLTSARVCHWIPCLAVNYWFWEDLESCYEYTGFVEVSDPMNPLGQLIRFAITQGSESFQALLG